MTQLVAPGPSNGAAKLKISARTVQCHLSAADRDPQPRGADCSQRRRSTSSSRFLPDSYGLRPGVICSQISVCLRRLAEGQPHHSAYLRIDDEHESCQLAGLQGRVLLRLAKIGLMAQRSHVMFHEDFPAKFKQHSEREE